MSKPYADAAKLYFSAGWANPIPVRGKRIPATGYTGYDGASVSYADIAAWIDGQEGAHNIGLRMAGTIGIDVDAHDGEIGNITLERAQATLGELPPTWSTTSRGAGDSRILIYNLPQGASDLNRELEYAEKNFVRDFGPNVEILHRGHRYAIAWPSVHPDTGAVYQWYRPNGERSGEVPKKRDLATLPAAWWQFLTAVPQDAATITAPAAPAASTGIEERLFGTAEPHNRRTMASAQAILSNALREFSAPEADGRASRLLPKVALIAGHGIPGGFWSEAEVRQVIATVAEKCGYIDKHGRTSLDVQLTRGLADGARDPWTLVLEAQPVAGQPAAPLGQDRFTDAYLAEVVAKGALIGRYCRTVGLGWMRWSGKLWEGVDEGAALEAVRRFALARYVEALEAERVKAAAGELDDDYEQQGWKRVQSAPRLKAVLSLAGNIAGVLRDAADFDTHHDLLNTPAGVLDLTTGEMAEHNPALMFTKMTSVSYKPGATSEAFAQVLESVPPGCRDWLQERLGQAATGHMSSDERMVLLAGGGGNGKTALMETVFRALGGYASAVPNTLLLTGRSPGGATPEKMTIRGVRLAYIEETPEDRHLDTQALKEVVGTPTVTGRELYKGYVTFGATHSLFLNTNHPPRVAETDNGTWRRLARLDFPYRYVSPGAPLERPEDRHGDPRLKARLGTVTAREGALAWLVAGARRWYEAGRVFSAGDPDAVSEATRAWRHESDLILRYLDERMDFDRDSWVSSQETYEDFRAWSRGQGHKDIPQTLFAARLKNHTALPAYISDAQKAANATGRSRAVDVWSNPPTSEPKRLRCVVGLRFKSNTE